MTLPFLPVVLDLIRGHDVCHFSKRESIEWIGIHRRFNRSSRGLDDRIDRIPRGSRHDAAQRVDLESIGGDDLGGNVVRRRMRDGNFFRICGPCLVRMRRTFALPTNLCSGIEASGNASLDLVHSVSNAPRAVLVDWRSAIARQRTSKHATRDAATRRVLSRHDHGCRKLLRNSVHAPGTVVRRFNPGDCRVEFGGITSLAV